MTPIIALRVAAASWYRSMEIPYTSLSEEALIGVIEEFVTREGTEYGAAEVSLEEKVAAVMAQLARKEARIVFDEEAGSVSIISTSG